MPRKTIRLAAAGAIAAAAAGPAMKEWRKGNAIKARLLARNWRRLIECLLMIIQLFALEGLGLNEGMDKLI